MVSVYCIVSGKDKKRDEENLTEKDTKNPSMDDEIMRNDDSPRNLKTKKKLNTMSRLGQLTLLAVLLVCICLQEVNAEGMPKRNDETRVINIRSLRNWFRIPEPEMIARVSKRGGRFNDNFALPDSNMIARVSKRFSFGENFNAPPKQMVARVSKKEFYVPDKNMVARVSRRAFHFPDKNMVARVSKRDSLDEENNKIQEEESNHENVLGYLTGTDSPKEILNDYPVIDSTSVQDNNDDEAEETFGEINPSRTKRRWILPSKSFVEWYRNHPQRRPYGRQSRNIPWNYIFQRPSRYPSLHSWHK